MKAYNIVPVPKPRQTRRDKWLKPARLCVQRYRDFATEVMLQKVYLPPHDAYITFEIPMPASWSERKKKKHEYRKHEQTPDLDNLIKALFDSVYSDDSHIWHLNGVQKIWAREGRIIIK